MIIKSVLDDVHYNAVTEQLEKQIIETWNERKEIKDQKEFALQIKDKPFSTVLFSARKDNLNPLIAFYDKPLRYRLKQSLSILNQN